MTSQSLVILVLCVCLLTACGRTETYQLPADSERLRERVEVGDELQLIDAKGQRETIEFQRWLGNEICAAQRCIALSELRAVEQRELAWLRTTAGAVLVYGALVSLSAAAVVAAL